MSQYISNPSKEIDSLKHELESQIDLVIKMDEERDSTQTQIHELKESKSNMQDDNTRLKQENEEIKHKNDII